MLHGKDRYMVVPTMEIGRAREENPSVISMTPEEMGLRGDKRWRLSEWAFALAKTIRARSVCVPRVFPVGVARALEKKGLRVVVAEQSLVAERVIKSGAELEKMRSVQRATANAMRYAFAVIERARVDAKGQLRDGASLLTSEALRRQINRRLLEDDCQGGEPIVACGPRSSGPHWIGFGPLSAGHPIVLDIFPRHQQTGYWGDMTRTVAKGYAPPELARMYRAVMRVQTDALARVRAGVDGAVIHQEAVRAFDRLGFPRRTGADGIPEGFIHGTGHGVGLEVHEAPSVSVKGTTLRAGHVVTVEPGLYYKHIGGVRIEDTVAVTRRGCELLASCPKRLVIA
jgi:Xaa-Pro aminopeptidase